MTQTQNKELEGSEKQVEKALFHREKMLEELDVFKDYLMDQKDAKWFLDRKFFNVAVSSFCKERREHFKALKQQQSQSQEHEVPEKSVGQSQSYPETHDQTQAVQMPKVQTAEASTAQEITR